MSTLTSSDGWSVTDMPDQSSRTVAVTGANSGIGFEATKAFARKGATVVMACRSPDRGWEARKSIREEVQTGSLSVMELNLADLESVADFARSAREDHDALDVLCINAGVMGIPERETAQGFEYQVGVNHLGHFALTGHLLESLRAGDDDARIVTQSSGLHERGQIDSDSLGEPASYDEWEAYARSKLANVLFAYELERRLPEDAGVASVACHPGYADTGLQRRGPEMVGDRLRLAAMKVANALLAQSARKGALPMLYAATHLEIDGGEYVGPGGFGNMRGPPDRQRSSETTYDEGLAGRVWERSVELTGVEYGLD